MSGVATGVAGVATGVAGAAVKGVGGTFGAVKGVVTDAVTNVKGGVTGAVESVTGSGGTKDKQSAQGGNKEAKPGFFESCDAMISKAETFLDPTKVAAKITQYSLLGGEM